MSSKKIGLFITIFVLSLVSLFLLSPSTLDEVFDMEICGEYNINPLESINVTSNICNLDIQESSDLKNKVKIYKSKYIKENNFYEIIQEGNKIEISNKKGSYNVYCENSFITDEQFGNSIIEIEEIPLFKIIVPQNAKVIIEQ